MCVAPLIYNLKINKIAGAFNNKTVYSDFILKPSDYTVIPCGKCNECLKSRANLWSLKLCCESKQVKNTYFITLTYSPECLKNIFTFEGKLVGTLCKKDLQNFFKRLRKYISFSYYAIGDYGDTTFRPHYHIILFTNDNIDFKCENSKYGESGLISKVWKLGHHQINNSNSDTVHYTAGYVLNKKDKKEYCYINGLVYPFQTFSHSHKLGASTMFNLISKYPNFKNLDVNGEIFNLSNNIRRFLGLDSVYGVISYTNINNHLKKKGNYNAKIY